MPSEASTSIARKDGTIVLARLLEFPDDHTFMALAKEALKDGDLPALCFIHGVLGEVFAGSGGKWGQMTRDVEAAVKARCQP